MSSSNLVRVAYKKETSYGVTPAAVKALLVVQDITYTAVKGGSQGNSITIEYTDTETAGAETVTVTGNTIVVGIESGVSTATQVDTAIGLSAAALLLITRAITGTAGDPQTVVAETPLASGSGEFLTARFTSEKYSGTPETTESVQIRTDRMSSGQVVTGLTVAGGHSIELAKETAIEDFLESAMFNAWDTSFTSKTRNLAIDASAKTITAVAESFVTEGLVVGDIIVLSDFADAGNNVPVMVTDVTALVLTYAGPTGMVTVSESATYQRADKLTIGVTKKSLTVEKTFTDLTTKALIYRGCIVSQMDLNVEYGALISGSFDTSGNDYVAADAADEFASYLEYFADPATTNSLNGSVDMPFLTTDVTGVYDQDAFCIQSLSISLSNNLTTQTCIGRAAPEDYTPGTAAISVDLSSYLKDANWDLLARKLSQESFALGFLVNNVDGWYGFYMPAIQVSFDDPASGGQNQDISMEMTGAAKVGDGGESALSIYRLPA
jgi:hypothetical protein